MNCRTFSNILTRKEKAATTKEEQTKFFKHFTYLFFVGRGWSGGGGIHEIESKILTVKVTPLMALDSCSCCLSLCVCWGGGGEDGGGEVMFLFRFILLN